MQHHEINSAAIEPKVTGMEQRGIEILDLAVKVVPVVPTQAAARF